MPPESHGLQDHADPPALAAHERIGLFTYSIGWKNHRQRIVADGVRVDEANCYRCGQPWPCEVAQAFNAGYQRGLEQANDE